VSKHLKPQEFDDLLLGIAASATMAHLNGCPECRRRSGEMRQTLGAFRATAVGWSEGAAKQVQPLATERVFQRRMGPWLKPAWALATAAVLLAVTIPLSIRRGHSQKTSATADAQAQISRDNELLAHIESEVGETTPGPMQPLRVNP
jgi:anti-sigma factor RsiW